MKAGKQTKAQRISQLERQVAELEAQLIHRHHFADAEIIKASTERMKGSGVVVSITALGGKRIVDPIMICNGLSIETIEALRSDIRRSFLYATELKPKEV